MIYRLFFALFLLSALFASDIAVVSMAIGEEYRSVVQPGIENKQAYCKKHGYEFTCCTEWLDPDRPISWSKVPLLLQMMEDCDSKWFFWNDADSMITNLAIPLEDFIDEEYDLIITKDNVLCAGQFFIRNCKEMREFLRQVYAHEECINHPWWEQKAFILELEQNQDFRNRTKVVPTRLFNSYPKQAYRRTLDVVHQRGDFLVHFAGLRGVQLTRAFQTFEHRVIDDLRAIDIDSYLNIYSFKLNPTHSERNEGYIRELQKKQIAQRLRIYPHISSLVEIGLNGGHSMAHFFNCIPHLERVLSFDINRHPYTDTAVEYFTRFYREQFTFVEGDSAITVPQYAKKHQGSYDLIYIDGGHSYWQSLKDITHCKALAHPNTILWIDDYNLSSVRNAIEVCANRGLIQIVKIFPPEGREHRSWVEARYK